MAEFLFLFLEVLLEALERITVKSAWTTNLPSGFGEFCHDDQFETSLTFYSFYFAKFSEFFERFQFRIEIGENTIQFFFHD